MTADASQVAVGYKPLAGIRVLELARLFPGALVTQRLANLGAEVVKVEEPGRGDYLRWLPPRIEGTSVLFRMINRGKKSIELDLKSTDGMAIFLELVAKADVVVEGSRPGAFAKRGLDWAEVRRAHPNLVVCSISAFGQNGPLAQLPSHGWIMDALSGSLTVVEVDGEMQVPSMTAWAVEIGAANATVATLAAVMHARATGEGAWIDASLWDSGVDAHRPVIGAMLAGIKGYGQTRPTPLSSIYRASDGKAVILTAVERNFWESFCLGVERADLIDSWNAGSEGRNEMGSAGEHLRAEIAAIIASAPAATWAKRFAEWGVPGAPVLSEHDLLGQPHLAARGLVTQAPGEPTPVMADPIRFIEPDFRPGTDSTPAPELGADTAEVLARWRTAGRP